MKEFKIHSDSIIGIKKLSEADKGFSVTSHQTQILMCLTIC